ncbi:MAG: hypothetical protein PHI15_01500 [Methanomicrobium sp.]|nr:hypothetical protein [Methanomicrobium sp.]
MKKIITVLLSFGLLLMLLPSSAVAATIGGDQAWFNVHCNVDGAAVYFDGDYKGVTFDKILTVPVYTTATPYKTITVEMDGYTTWTYDISGYPEMGDTLDVYATINPVPTPVPTMIGGDMGFYTVYCNVDGASVYFDSDYKGTISNGELTVSVYTTGTPYSTYQVKMQGYDSFTGQITDYPAKGETVKLHASLTPSTNPTPAPVSIFVVVMGLVAAGFVFFVRKN